MLDRFIPYRILSPHGWILLLDNKNIHIRFFFNPFIFHNMKLTSLIAFSSPLQPILMVSTILLFIKSYRTFMICRFDDDWCISWYNQCEWKEVVVFSNIISSSSVDQSCMGWFKIGIFQWSILSLRLILYYFISVKMKSEAGSTPWPPREPKVLRAVC